MNIKKLVKAMTGSHTTTTNVATVQPTRQEFGLLAWLEETRVRLPLKGVECRFEVCGDIADVKIEQVFIQTNKKPLNCTYSFPLPGNAAVYSCQIQIGARTIRAMVEDSVEASRIYTARIKEGHRAALVEVERDNLFTLSLGNLQPQDVVVVKLAYFQTLDRVGKQLSLMIPFCPGVRYIPGFMLGRDTRGQGTMPDTDQVPDASRVTPPRMTKDHEDAAYVNIEGVITGTDVELSTLVSAQHLINTEVQPNGVAVRIDMKSEAVPDRDFILRWEEPKQQTTDARAWHYQDGGETFAIVQLRAPEQIQRQESYLQDHYFLLDRSGSMQGEKWHKTVQALSAFVRELGPTDRVWITLFSSTYLDFTSKPELPGALLKDAQFCTIEKMETGGGTEMLPAIQHVLKMIDKHSGGRKERHANLILITDGQVGNEESIQKAFRAHPHIPLFAFGIDTTVNDAFLRSLARQQKGDVVFQSPAEDIARAVAALGAKLCRPVVTKIAIGKGWEPAGAEPQNLYEASVVDVILRATTDSTSLAMAGELPDGKVHNFAFRALSTTNIAVKLLWVKHRITWLLDNQRDAEAVQLAKANNILCRGTSFIAWDEAEKVPVAGQEVYQPAFIPDIALFEPFCRSSSMSSSRGIREPDSLERFMSVSRCSDSEMPALRQCALDALNSLDTCSMSRSPGGQELIQAIAAWTTNRGRDQVVLKFYTDITRAMDDWNAIREVCEQFVVSNTLPPKPPGELLDPLVPPFQSPAGREFLKAIAAWSKGHRDREQVVLKFYADIIRAMDDRNAIRKICEEFVITHALPDKMSREVFDERVDQLARELHSAGPDARICTAYCKGFINELTKNAWLNLVRQL